MIASTATQFSLTPDENRFHWSISNQTESNLGWEIFVGGSLEQEPNLLRLASVLSGPRYRDSVRRITMLPPISVRQPQSNDIVNDPVGVSGIGTGFEGVFSASIYDNAGTEISTIPIYVGGTGIRGNFYVELPLNGVPASVVGRLDVYHVSEADGRHAGTVSVPIVFGPTLINPHHGFGLYTVLWHKLTPRQWLWTLAAFVMREAERQGTCFRGGASTATAEVG